MAKVRVQLPLGALQSPEQVGMLVVAQAPTSGAGVLRARRQDVGKPGIPRASGARDRQFKSGRPDFLIRHQITVIDLPVKQGMEVRSLLPELLSMEGQANR